MLKDRLLIFDAVRLTLGGKVVNPRLLGVSKRNSYWAIAVALAVILTVIMAAKSGYIVGRDMALRDNARDAATPSRSTS